MLSIARSSASHIVNTYTKDSININTSNEVWALDQEEELLDLLQASRHNSSHYDQAEALLQLFRFFIYQRENYEQAILYGINGISFSQSHGLHKQYLLFLAQMVQCQMMLAKDLTKAEEYLTTYQEALESDDDEFFVRLGDYYVQRIIGRKLFNKNEVSEEEKLFGFLKSKECLKFFSARDSLQNQYYKSIRRDIALYYNQEYGLHQTLEILGEGDTMHLYSLELQHHFWQSAIRSHVLIQHDLPHEAIQILTQIDPSEIKNSGSNGGMFYYSLLEQAYEALGEYELAYMSLKEKYINANHLSMRTQENSIISIRDANKLELIEQKNKQLKQRNIFVSFLIAILVISMIILYIFYSKIKEQRNKIEVHNIELYEINEAKNQLFAILAHDLNQPISSFQNISQKVKRLIDKREWETLDKMGDQISSKIEHLDILLKNLLPWAKVQSNNPGVHISKINLKSFLDKCILEASGILNEKKIHVKNDIKENVIVAADPDALQIIVRNICSNAIKYSPENSRIDLQSSGYKDMIRIVIKDQGIGINERRLKTIFHEHKSTDGIFGEKGSGLGLKLSKDLALRNGGNIEIFSDDGNGTTVYLTLPKG